MAIAYLGTNQIGGGGGGGQDNVIEVVKVNGTALEVTDKAVDVPVPTKVSDLTNDAGYTTNTGTLTGVKFNGTTATVSSGVASITATIPSAPGTLNTNNSTAQTVSSSEALSGAIKLHKVAKTGTYSDLIGTPSIPSKTSDLQNDSGFVTSSGITSVSKGTATSGGAVSTSGGAVTIQFPTVPSAPGTLVTNKTTAQTASSGEAMSGTINLHKIAKTGTYSDLIGTPSLDSFTKAIAVTIDTRNCYQSGVGFIYNAQTKTAFATFLGITSADVTKIYEGGFKYIDASIIIDEDGDVWTWRMMLPLFYEKPGAGPAAPIYALDFNDFRTLKFTAYDYTIESGNFSVYFAAGLENYGAELNTTNTTAQSTNSAEKLNGVINLHKIAKTGTYSDLIGTPTIPSKTSDLQNDSGFVTSSGITSVSKGTATSGGAVSTSGGSVTIQFPTVPTVSFGTQATDYVPLTVGSTTKNVLTAHQSLSSYVPTSRTINSKALSSNITLTLDDIGNGSTRSLANYLPLAGGTMTGVLHAKANQYTDAYDGALDMANSDIYALNSIYTADLSNSQAEGIHFYRTETAVDTLRASNGVLYFAPNRTLGTTVTEYTVIHSGNYTSYLGGYVKTNPGAAEQTIQSSISGLGKGIINLWRSSGDHYTFLGFSNGSTETYLGGIGFKSQSDANLYRRDSSGTVYKIWDEGNSNSTSVAWSCSTLTANGAITGATNIDGILTFDTTNTGSSFKTKSFGSSSSNRHETPALGAMNVGTTGLCSPDGRWGLYAWSNAWHGYSCLQNGRTDGSTTIYALNLQPLGGNVGIGTMVPSQVLHVIGNILATGTISPGSDSRIKGEQTDITKEQAFYIIEKLNPKTWIWNEKSGKELNGKRAAGLIAQEVKEIIPDSVTISENGDIKDFHSLNYNTIQGYEIAAIKGLIEEIKSLKAEIAELKKQIN